MESLRIKALHLLENQKELNFSDVDIKELIHELNVYQIELELQNQELREKEESLLQTQDELSHLFMYAPIGYFILDKDYIISKYNYKAFEIFKFRNNRENIHIYSFFKGMSRIEAFMNWTKKSNPESFEIEIINTHNKKCWISLKHEKTTLNNKVVHLFSVSDITEEKEKKEKLHIFGTILEQLPVSIIITDHKGNIIYVNKELLSHTGYFNDELIGEKPSIFKSGYTSSEEYKDLWKTIKDGKVWRGLFKNLTKDKKSHWMATAITPIYNDRDEITHFISVETNIDEKIKMEEALKTQEDIMLIQARHAAMGEMISMIAHQWRQPLSVISTISSGLKLKKEHGISNMESDFNDLDNITNTTQYLSETIDDFKNFFRKDKIISKIEVIEIIQKIIKLNSKILSLNGIELIVNNSSTIRIYTYTNELLQILINLITNSKDAFIERNIKNNKNKIFLNAFDSNDSTKLIIEISDNAGGIDKHIIGKIFDPYFTTKGPASGTGLGLYITKTIIDKHLKGSISVKNNEDGASFIIEVPSLHVKRD